MKAKKTSRTVLAMLMVFTMLLGCGGFSALAADDVKITESSGGDAIKEINEDVNAVSEPTALSTISQNENSAVDATVNGNVVASQSGQAKGVFSESDSEATNKTTVNGDVTVTGNAAGSTDNHTVIGTEANARNDSDLTLKVNGTVTVSNTGSIDESSTAGVQVSSVDGGLSSTSVTDSVEVTDASDGPYSETVGLRAVSENYNSAEDCIANAVIGGDVTVNNSSAQSVSAVTASSFEAGSKANANVSGAISAEGDKSVSGISAIANAGGHTEVSAASVTVTGGQEATGVTARAAGEGSSTDVAVAENVTAKATGTGSHAHGIDIRGNEASVKTGDVSATADSSAVGVDLSSTGTVETGTVTAEASYATGLSVFGQNADVTAADVSAKGRDLAYGVDIHSMGAPDEIVKVTADHVSASASEGSAIGIGLTGPGGAVTVTADEITATAEEKAAGLEIHSGGSSTVQTGSITADGNDACGVEYVMDISGTANVTVNGDILAESDTNTATGILVMGQDEKGSPNAPVGQVNMTVDGNITATGPSSAEGIRVENYGGEDTGITVSGDIRASLTGPDDGFSCGIGIYVKDAVVTANVEGNVAGDDTGINVAQFGGNDVTVAVKGNVEGNGGILVQQYGEDGNVEILIESDKNNEGRIGDPEKGNVKGNEYGLLVNTNKEDSAALADVVVSGTLEGGKAAVRVHGSTSSDNLKLTVFKVSLNEDGHAIVAMSGDEFESTVSSNEQTEALEKESILYIIKVQQPEGATLTALKEDGSALETSHDYQVAKEGETVLMKVDLAEGYKVTGAYSVDGNENLKIFEKDGQYYVEVPKGGDVYISARLEKLAAETDSGAGSGAGAAWTGSLQLVDVTFDFNGGHKLSGSTAPVVKTVPVGTWVVLLDAPRKDGAEFLGWKADKEEITVTRPGENFRAMENVTFTAMWSGEAEPAAVTNTAAMTNDAGRSPIQASPLIHESTGTEAPAAAEMLSATVTDEAASPDIPAVEAPAAEPATEAEEAPAELAEETVQPAAEEETASSEAPAASDASVGDAALNLVELLGSASPTGEGSALQAKLVVDLPSGGSLEIPVNIQLTFGTPTILDNP